MDNPVNISDVATLIFWCRIDLHRNILVLTRVYSFIYARVRSCCSVVWRPSALEDEDEDCTTIIIFYCTICSAILFCYDYWMYNQCITLIVFTLLYIIISNVYFNSFMNCYLLLYVIVPLRDSVLSCSVLFWVFHLFFFLSSSLFFLFSHFLLSLLFLFFLLFINNSALNGSGLTCVVYCRFEMSGSRVVTPTNLPSHRTLDHHINLQPNTTPFNVRLYRYPYFQKNETEKQVKNATIKNYSTRYKSFFLASVTC